MLSKQGKTEQKRDLEKTRVFRSSAETADIHSSLPTLQHGALCPVVCGWDSPVTPLWQEGQGKGVFWASYIILNRIYRLGNVSALGNTGS